MAASKKITFEDYFSKNTKKFIAFGETFTNILNDKELISALAQKDLEKLAKVWKLVFEMLIENSSEGASDRLTELIGAYREIDKDSGKDSGKGEEE